MGTVLCAVWHRYVSISYPPTCGRGALIHFLYFLKRSAEFRVVGGVCDPNTHLGVPIGPPRPPCSSAVAQQARGVVRDALHLWCHSNRGPPGNFIFFRIFFSTVLFVMRFTFGVYSERGLSVTVSFFSPQKLRFFCRGGGSYVSRTTNDV